MRKTILTIFILTIFVVSFSYLLGSCKKDQNTKKLELLKQEIPDGFPQPVNTFADNPLSKVGFELGRKLFYDGRLSIDNEHPCSSCHQQIAGFGTYHHDRSHGVFDSHTLRNAPVLFNLAWNSSFHWDGEFSSLRDEIAQPINGPIEMGETWEGIINKIKDDKDYQRMFKEVFRYPFIRPEFILKVLEQFTGSFVSANSKYDQYKKGVAPFTIQEEAGYQLFKTKCATCHPEPLFTDYNYRNIGLPVDPFLKDYGRMRITGLKSDSLKFKAPTLRNCFVSENYMHDGRFNTLAQCINHYRTGVQQSSTLDPSLSGGISLTNAEADNLYQFLKTLTDSSFLINPRFSKPD
ncbi:MAG: c-type cytochrome [Sphingobacteriales bacterium]|nr:c-type cytochrome [Sphingobacteriales bacterium]